MTREEILEKYIQKIGLLASGQPTPLTSTEYLAVQLNAIHNLIQSKLEVAEYYEKKYNQLRPERLTKLEEMLESERLMNAILTEELENRKL